MMDKFNKKACQENRIRARSMVLRIKLGWGNLGGEILLKA